MKRLILALTLALLCVLASCGEQQAGENAPQNMPEQQNTVTLPPQEQETNNNVQATQSDNKDAEKEKTDANSADTSGSSRQKMTQSASEGDTKGGAPKSGTQTASKTANNDTSEKQEQPKETQPTGTPTKDEGKEPQTPKEEPKKQTVTVSIRGSKSVGTILEATEAAWNEGDTAFSVLKNITRAQGIQMEFSGSGASVYVEEIANLYEFDEGATSGWVYRVNGTLVSKSAGACVLHPGDRIEWIYTLNLGKDLN